VKKELLLAALALRGISSAKLAELSGLDPARVNRLRRGIPPQADGALVELEAVAKALDIPPSALVDAGAWPGRPSEGAR